LSIYHDGAGCKISSCDCRKKGKDFRGEGNAPWDIITTSTYRSISNPTKWLVGFSIVTMIITVIALLITSYRTFLGPFSETGSLGGLIGILAFIIKLFWYYWATKNTHSFGAREVTSPIMAAIWWIVPIFFFWKPYHVTQQIWKASNPEVNLAEGNEWTKNPSSKLIKQWWALDLVSIVGAAVVAIISLTSLNMEYNMETEQLEQSTESTLSLFGIPFGVIGIISTILFIRIIRQISRWQEIKSGTSI
jgi:hypothetical protein